MNKEKVFEKIRIMVSGACIEAHFELYANVWVTDKEAYSENTIKAEDLEKAIEIVKEDIYKQLCKLEE